MRPGASAELVDCAAHAGRVEFALARLAAGPARGALEPGGQRLGIGEERDLLPGDCHLADRDRFSSVGGDARLQDRPIIGDRVQALKFRRRRGREGAIGGARRAGKARPGGKRDHEKAQQRGQGRFLGLNRSF